MTEPPKADDSLNLDSIRFEELGRSPVREDESEVTRMASPPDLADPPKRRRCDSSQREILGNHFPET